MEKGIPRSSSSSTKTSGTESKNKQDAANKYLRLPRYKESVSPRPETRRKPNPQRNRELFDKRPRNRAGLVYEKYRSEIAEDAMNDSLTKQGFKKINLNHLLNFTLAPIDNREVMGRRAMYNRSKLPKYNKELFLQANCQFIARDDGNYAVHLANPDILVEWSLIEEIHLPSHEETLCPICLYTPVAAKITRCGHIYCWPCMLHYLALTDRTWQKCPICFDAVHKTELKSVSLRLQKHFAVGNEVTLHLMKREKGSLLPIPASYKFPLHYVCNVNDDSAITRFQKLLLASKAQVFEIIKRERLELQNAYLKDKDTPEACFIETALKLLDERETCLTSESRSMSNTAEVDRQNVNILNTVCKREHLVSTCSTDSFSEEVFELDDVNSCGTNIVHNSPPFCSNEITSETERKGNRFFYQAEDGQHIFMHNINVRMLLKEFGSLEEAPEIITATIVEIERVTMTEVLRKRLRYLQHLPLTCEFQVVEMNFSSLLSRTTMQQFEGEINKRKQLRNRKAQDERRREKYIEQEEKKKLGKYPGATYNLKSPDQFPAYDPNTDFQSLSPPISCNKFMNEHFENEAASLTNKINQLSVHDNFDNLDTEHIPVTSFAQMLKDGQAKAFTTTPESCKKVTLMPQTQDSDGDEWVSPPEYRQSFSDAIQAALDSVSAQDTAPADSQRLLRKKKGKKKLLFTTSMCRNK